MSCAAAAAVLLTLAGCADHAGPTASAAGATSDTAADDSGDNVFMPDEQNLDDCVGLLPRPGCGSDARGGWRQYLTMGVLGLGLAFIGWRISRGVRARDRMVNDATGAGRTD